MGTLHIQTAGLRFTYGRKYVVQREALEDVFIISGECEVVITNWCRHHMQHCSSVGRVSRWYINLMSWEQLSELERFYKLCIVVCRWCFSGIFSELHAAVCLFQSDSAPFRQPQQFCNTLLFKARSNQMSQVNNKNVVRLNRSWDDKVGQILNATAIRASNDFDLMCDKLKVSKSSCVPNRPREHNFLDYTLG